MWTTIILNATLSIIIIFIVHHIWEYCKQNYTTQKTKDLVEMQASKYKQIAEDIERNSSAPISSLDSKEISNQQHLSLKIQPNDFLPLDEKEKEWVQTELIQFIDTL